MGRWRFVSKVGAKQCRNRWEDHLATKTVGNMTIDGIDFPAPTAGGQPMPPPPAPVDALHPLSDPYAQPQPYAQPDPYAQPQQIAQPAPHPQPDLHAPPAPFDQSQPQQQQQYSQHAPEGGLPHIGSGDQNAELFEAGRGNRRNAITPSGGDRTRLVKLALAAVVGLFVVGIVGALALGMFGGDAETTDVAAAEPALTDPSSEAQTNDVAAELDESIQPVLAETPFESGPGEPFTNETGAYTITPNTNWTPGEVPADTPEGSNAWDVIDASGEQVGFVLVGILDLTGVALDQEFDLDIALEAILEGMRASGDTPTGGVGEVNGRSFAVVSNESNGVSSYSVMELIDNGLLAATLTADPENIASLIDSEQDAMFTLTSLL